MFNFHKRTTLNKWELQWIGIIALGILIWYGGPMLTIGGSVPLELVANRLLIILLIIIIWVAYYLINLSRANRADLNLIADLSLNNKDFAKDFVTEAKYEESAELKFKFQSALRLLKENQNKNRFSQKYLYELPWYVIIGAPGSGKTTLLTNSGIRFPVKEGRSPVVKGVGGTRNCNWLVSDDAIFIDTAGRYTTQDSHKGIDATAWEHFLGLLKKYRPQRPLNGVLFTLSLSDLLTWSEEEISSYGNTLRRRAVELYDHLGITIPIYILLTKCDLIAGFTEFFEDLDLIHRAQVWGFTFPANPKLPKKKVSHYLDKLLIELQPKLLARIQKERDLTRRGLILDFPQQMELIKPLILRFLKATCQVVKHGRQPLLRGVYFTSGTQQGTPIDRVMHRLAGTFELAIQQLPVFSGHVKSFFITRLLKDVILKESELGGVDYSLIRRQNLRDWAVKGVILGVVTVLLLLWSSSYVRNKRALSRLNGLLNQYETLQAEVSPNKVAPIRLLDRLDTITAAKKVYQERSWYEGVGLYQGNKMKWAIERIYRKLLINDLLTLIKTRLEDCLWQYTWNKKTTNLSEIHYLLKIYLMLGMPERMEASVVYEWSQKEKMYIFPENQQLQNRLNLHLRQLFQLPLDALPLNRKLVTQARQILTTSPLHVNIYANLKSRFLSDHKYDVNLKEILSAATLSIMTTADGRPIEALKIPGWYTIEGYKNEFKKKGFPLVQKALNQNWVLGDTTADSINDRNKVYLKIQQLYFSDYELYWKGLFDNLKVKNPDNLSQAIHITDSLSGPDSPLKPLLLVLYANTAAFTETTHTDRITPGWYETAHVQASDTSKIMPQYFQNITSHFEKLIQLVMPSANQSNQLDEITHQLAKLRNALLKEDVTADSEIISESKYRFKQLPEPLKSWLLPLTSF
ncbi:MAG: type VI secretion system membrane subunit TssM [Desulfobacteraceae bacterium]|jgi:type VI secretion system protein ImpL